MILKFSINLCMTISSAWYMKQSPQYRWFTRWNEHHFYLPALIIWCCSCFPACILPTAVLNTLPSRSDATPHENHLYTLYTGSSDIVSSYPHPSYTRGLLLVIQEYGTTTDRWNSESQVGVARLINCWSHTHSLYVLGLWHARWVRLISTHSSI